MQFVQIVQFQSSKIDEMKQLGDDYEQAIGSDNKARRTRCSRPTATSPAPTCR